MEHYEAAARTGQGSLNGSSMEVEIQASLPKLQKRGRLHALRRISDLGRITYEALKFEGDGTVKNNVIARYLSAETHAQEQSGAELAVNPKNYKFKYRGMTDDGGRSVHVFQVTPRKKRVGMYKGELWIDAETYLRVRESGRFVKLPSIFLKKIEFTRKYEILDGVSVPLKVQSVVNTRLVGAAELNIEYSHVSLNDQYRRSALADSDAQ